MVAHIPHEPALSLIYGQSRDGYRGTFPQPVVEVREPVRVVSMRRSSNIILMAIADGNNVDYWRVTSPDDPRLLTLTSDDRSRAHGALAAIGQEMGNV